MVSICQSVPPPSPAPRLRVRLSALGGPALPKNIISQPRRAKKLFLTAAHYQRGLQMSEEEGTHAQPLTPCTVDTEIPAGVRWESVSGTMAGYSGNSWNRLVDHVSCG